MPVAHHHFKKPVTKIPSAFATVGAPSQVQSMPLPACIVRNFIYDYAVVKMYCTCSYAYLCVYVCVSLCVHVYVICIVCVYVGTYPGFQRGVSNFVH